MSIYISTSGIRQRKIADAVLILAEAGYTNIELSGGSKYYDELLTDLLDLKSRYGLNYRCHNYFPPPQENFVLNLSSQGENFERSVNHLKLAIEYSEKLDGGILGLHGGFRIEPKVDELGKKISGRVLIDYEDAVSRFFAGFLQLEAYAESKGIKLYIENNVFSAPNLNSFAGENPFLFSHAAEIFTLQKLHKFNLLLDVAHLKVSSTSLKLNFARQLGQLIDNSDYLHISDNDGLQDTNNIFNDGSELYQLIAEQNLTDKTFTLEIYSGLEAIHQSYKNLYDLINLKN